MRAEGATINLIFFQLPAVLSTSRQGAQVVEKGKEGWALEAHQEPQ